MRLRSPFALLCLGLLPAAASTWASTAQAAVPQGYTGTPYKGTPQAIPGRVELADLDEGGLNVAFFADHRRENAVQEGYSPISGDDYRTGNLDLPNICKTNKKLEPGGIGSEDFWEDGTRYPSEDNKFEYYMGYAHTVDWVRVTVNVAQAGTYNVSSAWACANPNCGLSIWFNDGTTTKTDNQQRPMDGENKSGIVMLQGTNDYHKWRKYPNFAKVTLSAGVQLMTFNLEVADHLQYGHLVFELEGGGGTGSGGSSAGGAAAGGQGSGGGSSTGGVPASGGAPVTGGAPGTGGAPATGGVPQSVAGTTGVLPGSGGSSSAGSGTGAPVAASTQDSSGCSLAAASSAPGSAFASLGLLLASSLLLRRRRA